MSQPLIHTHDEEMDFCWKKVLKLQFLDMLKYLLFHFSDFSVSFSANFQQLGMELITIVYLFSTVGDGIGFKRLLMAHTTLPWQ